MACSPEAFHYYSFTKEQKQNADDYYSSGLLKPDALQRNLENKIFEAIQKHGFDIVAVRKTTLTEEQVKALWPPEECVGFWERLKDAYMEGPSIFFIAHNGSDTIQKLNDLVGYREPTMAEPYTLRHKFGETILRNVIHSTSNRQTFWREVNSFFTPEELKQIGINLNKEQRKPGFFI